MSDVTRRTDYCPKQDGERAASRTAGERRVYASAAPMKRKRNSSPRVAIVSDPLVQRGGAEKIVADVLARIFPNAPIHAILYSATTGPSQIAHRVIPTGLQRIPGAARRHRWLLPFYPAAVESIDLRGFD